MFFFSCMIPHLPVFYILYCRHSRNYTSLINRVIIPIFADGVKVFPGFSRVFPLFFHGKINGSADIVPGPGAPCPPMPENPARYCLLPVRRRRPFHCRKNPVPRRVSFPAAVLVRSPQFPQAAGSPGSDRTHPPVPRSATLPPSRYSLSVRYHFMLCNLAA